MPTAIGDARTAATCGTWRGRKRIGTACIDGGNARQSRLRTGPTDRALGSPGSAFPARYAVIARPPGVGTFQFVVLATLRAAQLMRGCRPKVDGLHKATVIAQLEVSEGKVMQLLTPPAMNSEPSAISAVSEDAPAPVHTV